MNRQKKKQVQLFQRIYNMYLKLLDLMATSSSKEVHDSLEMEVKKYLSTKVEETEPIDWWLLHKEVLKQCKFLVISN